MFIYDLDTLRRDESQDDLYNFFVLTFRKYVGAELSATTVDPSQEMRIDLVSNSIYDSVDYCDLLMNINDIDNPLNIKPNDIIVYPPGAIVNEYRLNESNTAKVRSVLLNSRKSSRKDPNRERFVEQQTNQLPPNMAPVPTEPIRIENNQLVIGG